MEIFVQLVQEDIVSHEKIVLADGKASYLDRVLTYTEKDNPNVKHEISFFNDYVILKRYADIKSETYLRLNKRGVAKITSEYGEMKFSTYLQDYQCEEDRITIRYCIYQGNEVVTSQILVWILKGLKI